MSGYTLGAYIYDARKKMGITQEELAFGICSPGTLSKIENGFTIPKRRNYEALMQRLGKSCGGSAHYWEQVDRTLYDGMRKIIQCMAVNDVTGCHELLQQYADCAEGDVLAMQFMRYMTAIVHSRQKVPAQEVLRELMAALRLTVMDTEHYMKQKRMYTVDEILILNNIAIQYQRLQESGKAARIWIGMKDYLEERCVDEETKEKVYPLILCNCAQILLEMEVFREALLLFERGITICSYYSRCYLLPSLLYGKADCLCRLGQDEQASSLLQQADLLLELSGGHCAAVRSTVAVSV